MSIVSLWSVPMIRSLLVLAVGLLLAGCCFAQGPAAASTFGVYASAGGGSQGCGANWTYDTNTGGSGGISNNPSNTSISNCSGSSTGSKATGQITASASSKQQALFCGATVSSSDLASADLTMGTLRNYATTSGFCAYGPSTETDMWDLLTFNVPGATDTTITPITILLNLTSTYNDPSGYSSVLASLQVGANQVCQCTHGNDVVWGVHTSAVGAGAGNFGYFVEDSSFVTWGTPTASLSGIVIPATINLTGASPTLSFALQLLASAAFPNAGGSTPSTSTVYFPGTGGVLFLTLPPGVTYTSASGKFLSGTVPSVLAFSAIQASLHATTGSAGSFQLKSTFTLGATAPAFNPATQPVLLQVGPYEVAIPQKSFHLLQSGTHTGSWYFAGTINGVALKILITPQGSNTYQFVASGTGVDFTNLTSPALVSITTANNGGNTLEVSF